MEDTMLTTSQHTSGETSQFKFELLKQITNNFSEDRVIGSGAYGVVYEGVMDNGQKIAVKKLKYMTRDENSQKQFENECTNLMGVQHPYIVRLVGYCYETYHEYVNYDGKYVFGERNERALCFEYMEGRSLDKYISDKPSQLDWDKCFTIIKGVCKGLNHLHNHSILHLDIKPGNILLDNSMMPKIGDFGLSRLISSIKTSITTTPLGTPGYTPPEYVEKQEISPKYDVFSLGVLVIHIMAGRELYNKNFDSPSKITELVCGNWKNRLHGTMWSHASHEVMTCIKIALRCVKSDRHERPTMSEILDDLDRLDNSKFLLTHEASKLQITEPLVYSPYTNSVSMGLHDNATGGFDSMEGIDYKGVVSGEAGGNDRSMHDPMDSLHESSNSIMRDQSSNAIDGLASRVISEPLDVTQTAEVEGQHHRRNSYIRVQGNLHTPVTMDTIGNLFQWARSTISSRCSGTEGQRIRQELMCLESGLQYIMDSLPTMYNLMDRGEWRSHEHHVAKLLPNLKDAIYDAEDLLDEFRWYMLDVYVEGNGSKILSMEFFNGVSQGSFINSVNGIRDRLDNISTRLLNMGLDKVITQFEKSARPETSSFPNERAIFGRDMELEKIIEFICKPRKSTSANIKRHKGNSAVDVSTSTSATNQVSSESRIHNLTVLPIVGIGGIGKTTLSQHICTQVKSYFDMIIWVCVSDSFDVKRLTKEAIESCTGKQATIENLNSLQYTLSDIVTSKKFLFVLDDMWDDVLKEDGQCWNRFCAPFENVLHESVMLVTTRFQKVADRVGTSDPIILEGLKDDVFWKFFKLCLFGFEKSNNGDPELECIARSIVPKLKGSPLAAKTLGRILRMNLEIEYWNAILKSELWKLRQEETEILPALRLSYMYLPFHLKRCFSLCAMYPKDCKFQKDYLAQIWVAEGFVEPQGDIPIQDIGRQYFNDLLYRSFFQEVQGEFVIHDLLHDMAQKVSEFDCFIVRRKSDIKNIPRNVRHLSILSSMDIGYSNLKGLRCFTKLRTLLCNTPLANKSLVETWCSGFPQLRVIVFSTIHELPASIGNLKHLRYIHISNACPFMRLPTEFCWLYNLQFVCFRKCKLESLPADFSKLICLQSFESDGFLCDSMFRRLQIEEFYFKVSVDAENGKKRLGFRLIKNINLLGELVIYNIGNPIRKEDAAEAQLHNKKYLVNLELKWCSKRNPKDNDTEVLQFLQPPTCLKSLILQDYPGVSLPSWSHELESSLVPSVAALDLILTDCDHLSSLEHVIQGAYVPSLKKIVIKGCENLVSIPVDRFGDLPCLEVLEVQCCQNLRFPSLVAPSLKKLQLGSTQNFIGDFLRLGGNVDCCSLTFFSLSSNNLRSIELQKWNLPALEELYIVRCQFLTSIIKQSGHVIRGTGGIRVFPSLTSLAIRNCDNLSTIDDLLTEECLPAIERIHVKACPNLVSLPGERFGNFSSLKEIEIFRCFSLTWTRGFLLPSSLRILSLNSCGDISAWVPSCLQNLAFLVTLSIIACEHLTSIPGNLWSTNLTSLEDLMIWDCDDIESIGGENAISEIKNVSIKYCSKLEELEQPLLRGSYVGS